MRAHVCLVAFVALVGGASAQNGQILQQLLSVFGSLGGGGNGGAANPGGGLASLLNQFGGVLGQSNVPAASDAAGAANFFQQLLGQLGLNAGDLTKALQGVREGKEFQDDIDKSQQSCQNKKHAFDGLTASDSCGSIESMVFSQMRGGERSLNHIFASGNYRAFKNAVYLCYMREKMENATASAIDNFRNKPGQPRDLQWVNCNTLRYREDQFCKVVRGVLCNIVSGQHVDCTRSYDRDRYKTNGHWLDASAWPEPSIRGLYEMEKARPALVGHDPACDGYTGKLTAGVSG